MKTLIAVLILLSLLQTTLVPFDLVLIFLIVHSYISSGKENLYLGFAFGLLISYLSNLSLGTNSLLYLFLIQMTYFYKKLSLSNNIFFSLPLIIGAVSLNSFFISTILHASFNLYPKVLQETAVAVPFYFILKFWEERFTVKQEVKLRV